MRLSLGDDATSIVRLWEEDLAEEEVEVVFAKTNIHHLICNFQICNDNRYAIANKSDS